MNHLITGVAGFVASNLARKLLEAGHQVTGIDNMSCGYFSNIADLVMHPSGFHFEEGDVRDWKGTGQSFDAVWHLAARGELYYCRDNVDEAIDINIKGTLNMLKLAKETMASHFYFSDTSAEYDSFEGDVDIWYSSASPANFVTTTSQARHGTRSAKAVISNTATNWNYLGVDDNVVVLPSTSAHFISFVYYYKTICTSSSANPEFGFYLKQNNGNYLTIQESKIGTTNGWVRQQVNFNPNSSSQIIGFEFSFNDFDASIPSGTTCECYIDNVQVY